MKQKEYVDRNLQGFEGDTVLKKMFADIINKQKIEVVVETGTYLGGTTLQFAEMVGDVVTIESNPEFQRQAAQRFAGNTKIWSILAHSENVLGQVITKKHGDRILFFLDAHWEKSCPLLAELAHIAKAGIKPIIAIHDFKVQGTTLGYDSYNGQEFTFDYIKAGIEAIYGVDNYKVVYNDDTATGARRGCVFISPIYRRTKKTETN